MKPTRTELAARIQLHQQASKKADRQVWVGLAVALLPPLVFLVSIRNPGGVLSVIPIVWIFGWLLAPAILASGKMKRFLRANGLNCPECDAALTRVNGSIAVATLFCSACGNRIVRENETAPEADAQPSAPR